MRSGADRLEWLAAYLVMLELPFEVLEPPELIDALRSLGHRMLAAADGR